ERTAAELDYAQENAEEIAERTERLEVAIRQRCYIGGESHAQQIEGEDFTFGVREAEEIDGALAIFEKGLQRSFGTILREVAEKRVAGAEGKKSEGDARICVGVSEDAVEDLVSGAVTADGDKTAVALIVGFACEVG